MKRLSILALAAPAAILAQTAAPTTPAITDADLRVRVGIFAHDSLEGRQAGSEGHRRGTRYLVAELQRLGLRPAGDSGTFLQSVPFVRRFLAADARLVLGDTALVPWEDFAVSEPSPLTRSTDGAEVVYGGALGAPDDSLLGAAQARGKLVVLAPPSAANAPRAQEHLVSVFRVRFAEAAGIALLDAYMSNPLLVARARQERLELDPRAGADTSARPTPILFALGPRASGALRAAAGSAALLAGTPLGTARGDVRLRAEPSPSYNVVAVAPGRDKRVAGQYVAIGAHSDHVGLTRPMNHDSLRAFNQALVDAGAEDPFTATAQQLAAASRVNFDSLRRARPPRADSIQNGADDDASGSMALLEIAERLATAPERERPRRSVLLVWHTGEELGMVGSGWFTDHPTVPRDSIVAQINLDMIGRGGPRDVLRGGGPEYLQVIGSRRLSTELGRLVETVNERGKHGFTFDYQFDAPGHPQQYYCRSDHYSYARWGIPIAFFSSGGHADYHQITDEAQYLDYGKLARVTRFVNDVARQLADLAHRVEVDQPVPPPDAPCRQ